MGNDFIYGKMRRLERLVTEQAAQLGVLKADKKILEKRLAYYKGLLGINDPERIEEDAPEES